MSVNLLDVAKKFVQGILAGDSTGHDWPHVKRVLDMACYLASEHPEPLNMIVVQLAAILHDVPDWKLTDDVEGRYAQIASFLSGLDCVSDAQADHIAQIIRTMSWHTGESMATEEGKIVQDADRLDALGAIGIARCFAYGGKKGRPIFNPADLLDNPRTAKLLGEEYKASGRSSIAHFYDKLFHIEDRMNTPKAKEIAKSRTAFLTVFLNQFFQEWHLCG